MALSGSIAKDPKSHLNSAKCNSPASIYREISTDDSTLRKLVSVELGNDRKPEEACVLAICDYSTSYLSSFLFFGGCSCQYLVPSRQVVAEGAL